MIIIIVIIKFINYTKFIIIKIIKFKFIIIKFIIKVYYNKDYKI